LKLFLPLTMGDLVRDLKGVVAAGRERRLREARHLGRVNVWRMRRVHSDVLVVVGGLQDALFHHSRAKTRA